MNNDTVVSDKLKLTKTELDSLRDIFVFQKLGYIPAYRRIAQIERNDSGSLDIKVMLRIRINESKEKRQLVGKYQVSGKAIRKFKL